MILHQFSNSETILAGALCRLLSSSCNLILVTCTSILKRSWFELDYNLTDGKYFGLDNYLVVLFINFFVNQGL